ncbi:hypothetical protein ABI003_15150, partial [Enterococcus faecium]|uniref:hypothetical protein n=1 Tax=Enterococcus faecium TaxID=1352 RepID=UPI003F438869
FTYAAVASQYFASALAVDDTASENARQTIWDYVRPTREPAPWDTPAQPFLGDVTFRAVSKPLDPDAKITHKYLIYDGPLKVRLL